ncbi:MAG: hypothetical protein U0271_16385 [Polyangiaceae bacterium]
MANHRSLVLPLFLLLSACSLTTVRGRGAATRTSQTTTSSSESQSNSSSSDKDNGKSDATPSSTSTAETASTDSGAKKAEPAAPKLVPLPAAARKSAADEKTFGGLVTAEWSSDGTDDVVKVVLTDADWSVVRNEVTGLIVARRTNAAVVTKNRKDGKCRLFTVAFEQEAQDDRGTRFGKAAFSSSDFLGETACDGAK